MKVKELQKTVNIAWSPEELHPIYLASGSAAQQLDSNGNSVLEIYGTNITEPGYDLELKASLSTQYRFQKLVWSPSSYNGSHSNGLLVGGCEKGNLMVYSASRMLDGQEGLIAQQDSHTGPVRGLDFNPFQTNLIASVASESEIFIWDLNNTATHMTPGTKTQPLEDVQNVTWNRQVQHILASVFSSRCIIWDLRKNEQIIKLSDTQSRVRWHAVQWHPDTATQIWLASEEDQAPVIQMWDLRYATSPAKTMQIHQRGVLGMSWCSKDSDMVVSCGKDNRIYCWNPNTELPEGEILSEVAVTPQWYFDVQWCPKNPALIASSSLDGIVSVYSLFGGTQQQVKTSSKIADSFPGMDQLDQAPMPVQSNQITYSDPSKPPKWMKKQSGVKFGFGGKLLSFNSQSKLIHVQQLHTDQNFIEKASNLEKVLTNGNFIDFCRNKADEVSNQDHRSMWYFLKANFEIDPKEQMLNLLGYNTEDINRKFSKYLINDNTVDDNIDLLTNRMDTLTHSDSSEVEYNQSTDESSETSPSLQIKNNGPNFEPVNKLKEKTSKQDDENIITKGTDESLVSEAIITGNIEAAVELCFEICRPADALIIASTVGNDFLTKTHERYLRTRDGDLSNIISALITRDWIEYVSHCSLDSWKKALVAILKHGDRKIIDICEILGDRLLASDSQIECKKNALLCYICAGNIDKTIDAWYQINSFEKNVKEHELDNSELQALAEIAIILSKSLEMQGIVVEPEGKFADLVYLYGTRLVDQGATNIAVSYVFALGPSIHPKLSELRDRLNEVVSPKSYTGTSKKLNVIGSESFNNKKMNYNAQPTVQDSTVFSQNMYNTGLPTGNQWNVPPSAIQSVAQALPSVNMFNPQLQVAHNFNQLLPQAPTSQLSKPPTVSQASETFMHPPRPSSVSSQGSIPLTSRPKYILDPSVSGGSQYGSSNYSGSYNQPQGLTQNNFNTMPITSSSMHPSPMHPNNPLQNNYNSFNSMQPPQNRFLPGTTPIETASLPPPQTYVQRNPTPPPGWNDPPVLKSSKQQNKKPEPSASVITHPIFGIDPNHNGYLDSNTHYQNQTNFLALGSNQQPTVQVPYNVTQPMQTNFQTTNLSPNMPQQHTGYAEQPATVQQRVPEAPKEKSALPEEFIYMQTVFEELKSQCLAAASDPRTKRKFVDVTKRLENLYDCLTDRRLTSNTIESLNQIVQFIQIGDYNNALATHTSIAFGTDFAQTSSFMPGIKVLIQSAADLKVLLR